MKQLFIDLLTKCTPSRIGRDYIEYTIDRPEHQDTIIIDWEMIDSDINIKTELFLPFQTYKFYPNGDKRIFNLSINDLEYKIELNQIEINEVEHLIYQIFQQFQVNMINSIKTFINKENTPTPKTTEQQFEAAQEAVAENVSE